MLRNNLIYLSGFLLLISLFSFINIIYSYYFNLYLNLDSYLYSLIVSLIIGVAILFIKKNDDKISIFDKIFVVILGYLFLPFIISLPYYFSIYNISLLDSYFESISGFTSTGFTIFENIKHLDQSLILWRSTSQWIGGIYFLFSIILLIDIFDKKLKNSLTNFLSFNSSEFIKQLIKILILYVFLTFVIYILLKIINFRDFDAFNFALTIISSGGFKPVNDLNLLLNKDYKVLVFSILILLSFFSIFFTYNVLFYKKNNLNFLTEDFYLLLYLLSITFIFFIFLSNNDFLYLFFSIASSVSNIGFYLSDYETNYYFIYLILVIIGGSFFSTSSGLRFFKILTLIKFSLNELVSHTKPKQILQSKVFFDNNKIDYEVINKYFFTILVFIISLTLITSLISMSGIAFTTSIKLGVLTIMNTVNSGLYGVENLNFFEMSAITKSILIIFMIIGRVEFITIIILFKKYLFKN